MKIIEEYYRVCSIMVLFIVFSVVSGIQIVSNSFSKISNAKVSSQFSSLLKSFANTNRPIKCLNLCNNLNKTCNVVTFNTNSTANNCFLYYANITIQNSTNFTVFSSVSNVYVKKEQQDIIS